jgi:iron complex transport system substrate-binding protein
MDLPPAVPFGWIDRPPSLNRIMGLKWLTGLFHLDKFPKNLRETTRAFYRHFYHFDLTESELDTPIAWSGGQAPCWRQPARRYVAHTTARFPPFELL